MMDYPSYLFHHGVKGQKWGIRRFQNSDGTLTAKGRERYNVDKKPNVVLRGLFNTETGQRRAVTLNKGFQEDLTKIKEQYRAHKREYGKDVAQEIKKDAIKEARTAAADALYGSQSHKANYVIQNESTGKAFAKSLLLGGYGAKQYNTMRYQDNYVASKGKAAVFGFLSGYADRISLNTLSVADYALTSKTKSSDASEKSKKITNKNIVNYLS